MKRKLASFILYVISILVYLAEGLDKELTDKVFRKFSIISLINSGDLVEEEN